MGDTVTYEDTENRFHDTSKITLDKILQEMNEGAGGSSGTHLTEIGLANTLWVSKDGNDSTGLRERLDKPFLTCTAAKAAAQSGDTIKVGPGTYNENDLWKGVTWELDSGASIQYTDPGDGNGRGLFDDQSALGTHCIVRAAGSYFKHLQANGSCKGAFVLTNASSRLDLWARLIDVGEGASDEVSAIAHHDGTCFAKVTEIRDISEFDPSAAGSRSGGIFFKKGYLDAEVDYQEVAAYALHCKEPAGVPTATCLFRGKNWQHRSDVIGAQSLLFTDANNTGVPNLNYRVEGEVTRAKSQGGLTVFEIGQVFLTVDDGSASGNVGHEFWYGCEVYLTGKRHHNSNTSNISSLWINSSWTGNAVVRMEEWKGDGDNVVRLDGTGTLMMEGQHIRASNGIGMLVNGAGTWRIKGYRIDTTPTDAATNNPVSLGATTTGLVLEQCVLLAPAAAVSVKAAAARTIASYGSKANKAVDAVNVVTIAAGGELTVNAAVV